MEKLISEEVIKNDLLRNIAEKYQIPYDQLLLELSSLTKIKTTFSKYSCDHYFFSKDTEQSFYWAGFLASDGCVYKKNNSKKIILSLSDKDLDHLLKFKEHICFDGNVTQSISKHSSTNYKWKDSYKVTLTISSSQWFEDLKRFNIEPNKTKKYTFPSWLTNHSLVSHYMRGYVDGDGSFFYDKSRDRVCFELRGNSDFLIDFKNILESNLDKQSNANVTTPDSTSKIKYYGKWIVPQIVDFLYKDCSVFLQRKYDIALKSKNIIKHRNRYKTNGS
jgi:hypothetical protein